MSDKAERLNRTELIGKVVASPDWAADYIRRLERQLAAASECPAFEAGWHAGRTAQHMFGLCHMEPDLEHDWQEYRSRDDTEERA